MENVLLIDCCLALAGLIRAAFGILYGPIWILVLLFAVMGLVFICKALGCMGIRFGKSGTSQGLRTKEAQRPPENADFFGVVTGTDPKASVPIPSKAAIKDNQLEAVGLPICGSGAVNKDEEGAFVFWYDQELEDYLSNPEEDAVEERAGNTISLEFLPVVIEEDPDPFQLDEETEGSGPPEVNEEESEQQHREGLGGLPRLILPSERADEVEAVEAVDAVHATDLELPDFCIFEELFRTCDSESKLILLDELYAVGDQKELRFLQKLSVDPDPKVRNKAAQIREALEKALAVEAEVEEDITPLGSLDIRHWPVRGPKTDVEGMEHDDPERIIHSASDEQPVDTLQPLEACFLGDPSALHSAADTMDIEFEPDSRTMWEDGEAHTRIKVREGKIAPDQKSRKLARSLLELAKSFLIH